MSLRRFVAYVEVRFGAILLTLRRDFGVSLRKSSMGTGETTLKKKRPSHASRRHSGPPWLGSITLHEQSNAKSKGSGECCGA